MFSYSEEEVANHLQALGDAEPRADFVQALEELMVLESRRLKRVRQLSGWTKWGAAVAASLLLVAGGTSPAGQQFWKQEILHEVQQSTGNGNQTQSLLPTGTVTEASDVMYGATIDKKYYLCIADANTLEIQKKVLLSDQGFGTKLYRDPQGRIWLPIDSNLANDTRHEIAVYNPVNGQVTHLPFAEAVQDVKFVGQEAYVSTTENGFVKWFHLDATLQQRETVVLNASGDEKLVEDGANVAYYDLDVQRTDRSAYPGLVRWHPGEKAGQTGVLNDRNLVGNLELLGSKGQIFMNVKDNPGEFFEYDAKLDQKQILTWDQVLQESDRFQLVDHLQVKVGDRDETLLVSYSMMDNNGKGRTYFALVDSHTGEVNSTFHDDSQVDVGVNYVNGKFYVVCMNGPVDVFDVNGKREGTITPADPITRVILPD